MTEEDKDPWFNEYKFLLDVKKKFCDLHYNKDAEDYNYCGCCPARDYTCLLSVMIYKADPEVS